MKTKTFHILISTFMLLLAMVTTVSASNMIITKSFTGGWYDPTKSGQGFMLEIINNNNQKQALTTWFTFDNSGQQMWLIGVGEISDQSITFNMIEPQGGLFGNSHDPDNITIDSWGTVVFNFSDCNHGTVNWYPSVTGFSQGSMDVTRNTQINNLMCTGGLYDELADTAAELELYAPLNNTGLDTEASGHMKYEQRSDRIEFSVEIEDLVAARYDLYVAGNWVSYIDVLQQTGQTQGEVEFRDPVEAGKLLLDFDPRNQLIEVKRMGQIYLSSDELITIEQDDNTSLSAPPFGNNRFESLFNNLGIFPTGYAKAELRQRDDRVDFKVELEGVPTGFYDFSLNQQIIAVLEVRQTPIGLHGELEYRNPVEPGKLLLDFNPVGTLLELSQGSTVMFAQTFNDTGTGSQEDDNGNHDCDDTNNDCDDDGTPNNEDNCDSNPCQNNTPYETEVTLINSGVDSDASGSIDYRARVDRIDLKVETEDLALGQYQLVVGGTIITTFEVNSDQFELEFRDPVEPGKLDLNFEPLNQLFEIKKDNSVYLSAVLQ